MPREKTGSVVKRGDSIFARIRYVDETGKTKSVERKAENRSHAKRICKELLRELEDHGEKSLEAARLNFTELADFYEKNYLIEARYEKGRKIAGLRSYKHSKGLLNTLRSYFGKRIVRSITHGDLKNFRAERLNAPTRHDRIRAAKKNAPVECSRKISSVNRELSLLRKMFNVAVAEHWLIRNPFSGGDNLISLAAETKRERILTRAEETALLAACEHRDKWTRQPCLHLRPILIAALDTGARQGELLSLTWQDVDFEMSVLTLRTFKDKNVKERQVGMTARLKAVLENLWEKSDKNLPTLVFGIKSNVKNSFKTVCSIAGLSGLRFHDLRHTAASRLVGMRIPLSEVGRILGHSLPQTTYRYANVDLEAVKKAANALDNYHLPPTIENQTDDNETVH